MPVATLEKPEEIEAPVLLTAEGLIMMPIAVIFDLSSIICTILIVFFGIGYIAGIIVDAIAVFFFTLWSFVRGQFKKMAVEAAEGKGEKVEGSGISLPQRYGGETGKGARMGGEVEKATKIGKAAKAGKMAKVAPITARAARFAKWARWGKIFTPIKNRVPGLGLIPTWSPTIYFELQS